LFSPILIYSQTVEQMVETINDETDSLTKIKNGLENELSQLKLANDVKSKKYLTQIENLENKKLKITNTKDSIQNNLKYFNEKYGEKETIKRINPFGYKDRLKKLAPNTDSIRINRKTQETAYHQFKKLKLLFFGPSSSGNEETDLNRGPSFNNYCSDFIKSEILKIRGNRAQEINKLLNPFKHEKDQRYIQMGRLTYFYMDYETSSDFPKSLKTFPKKESNVTIGAFFLYYGKKITPILAKDRSYIGYQFQPLYGSDRYSYNDYFTNHSYFKSYKKKVLDEKLKANEVYILNGQKKEDYLYWYLGIDSMYFQMKKNIPQMKTDLTSLNNSLEIAEKKLSDINKEFNDHKYNYQNETSQFSNNIKYLENQINSKDIRIANVYENDSIRTEQIKNGELYMKEKNYEQAVNSFRTANNISTDEELVEKLKKARELYAPILAIKLEKEKLARIEREKREKEARQRALEEKIKRDKVFIYDWLDRKGYRLKEIMSVGSFPFLDEAIEGDNEASDKYKVSAYKIKFTDRDGRIYIKELIVIYKYNTPCSCDFKEAFNYVIRMGGSRGRMQAVIQIKVACEY
tara:strand:+ start:226 stop:1953 length:1728 start_codon:yes stop_codon:yes gene_type:complete